MDKNIEFIYAVKDGYVNQVKQLLQDDQVDPAAYNNQAIRWAVENGFLSIVKILLQDKRVDPSANDNEAIVTATDKGYYEITKELLESGKVNPSVHYNLPIVNASRKGFIKITKLLLESKPTAINIAIQMAATNNHLKLLHELLYNIGDISDNIDNNQLDYDIKEAAKNNYIDIVKLLIQFKPDLLKTAIEASIQYNHIDLLKAIINNSDYNDLPLKIAIQYNRRDIIKWLLQDTKAIPKSSYVKKILLDNDIEIMKLLLQNPYFDPGMNDNEMIITASKMGYTDMVRLLLQDKRVKPQSQSNATIRLAAENGHIDIVKLLLQDKRVHPTSKNNYALFRAYKNNHMDVVNLLLQDPRVDWRQLKTIRRDLINTEKNKLMKELTTSYLTIEKSVPTASYGSLQKDIIKQISYLAPYQELCEAVSKNEIPPVKLVALANILKINYQEGIKWSDLCNKVRNEIYKSVILY